MKLIHLSDLHLGKRLGEISLLEDQIHILHEILGIVDEEKPDAVLIAGDVYDRSLPSVEAVSLFDDFLYRLAERNMRVYVIGGNHDSLQRLSFGARLMEGSGIHIAGGYAGTVEPYTLHDAFGELRIYLLPFVKPTQVMRYAVEEDAEKITDYTDAVRVAIAQMQPDPSVRNVLLAHQFVTGAQQCESEELSVGGLDNVDCSVFEPFDYVALGHIHSPQTMRDGRVRYCGTPLKYSFSEEGQEKSVTVAELGEKGGLTVRTIPLKPLRDMRVLRGHFQDLIKGEGQTDRNSTDYIRIMLLDEDEVQGAYDELHKLYPNLLSLQYDNRRTRAMQSVELLADAAERKPLDLFAELYELQNGQPLCAEQEELLQRLIEDIWEGEE